MYLCGQPLGGYLPWLESSRKLASVPTWGALGVRAFQAESLKPSPGTARGDSYKVHRLEDELEEEEESSSVPLTAKQESDDILE